MLHRTMTRFHIAVLIAALLGAAAIFANSVSALVAVVTGLLTAIALGVAIPRLRFFGPYVCRGNASRRWVALTFDDGPDSRSTPALLDLLRETGVQATFFAIGRRVIAESEVATRIVREGHLLESHSHAHQNTTNFFGVRRLRTELNEAQMAVRRATGIAPRMFRPPMGLSNPRVFRVARDLGLTVVGWTARGFDTQSTDPQRIVQRITRRLQPGAIILLHDGNIPRDRLVATVKLLLDTLRGLEYEVVRLDRMLA